LRVFDEKMGIESTVFRTIEGQLNVAHMLNAAYIKQLFPKTTVMSGIQYFPFRPNLDKETDRGMSVFGSTLFPICLCLSLPVFLYTIVMEKETKLIEQMKSNGLRMHNYWIVQYLFNLLNYGVVSAVFFIYGGAILGIHLIVNTSFWIIFVILLGWGLCQVSLSFFWSAFINRSQTATMLGYGLSIWITVLAITLNITLFSPPHTMSWHFQTYPTFTFARAFYHVCLKCGYEICPKGFSDLEVEGQVSIGLLYLQAVAYLFLGLYLHKVVPQTYGVPKHPCFCLKGLKKKGKKSKRRDVDEISDLEQVRENEDQPVFDYDLNLEDADSKAERNYVYNLEKSEYYKYPLIVKDLRKIYPGFAGRAPKVATKNFSLRIRKGEFFGLLGPNGAGKTTLISMLTGLYRPNAGNAWVAGYEIRDQLELVQLQIGVCP